MLGVLLPRLSGPGYDMYAVFPSTVLNVATTKGLSLNKRPPLRSAILLEMLQRLRGFVGVWVPRAQHMLLRGQRGREQVHGLDCPALVAQCSGDCEG